MPDPNQIKLVGTLKPGTSPSMQMGWPGVLRVLTKEEKRESERQWDERVEKGKLRG